MFWRSLAQIQAGRASKVTAVQPSRLALPLAIGLSLLFAAPAGAADSSVDVASDFSFEPASLKIDVGNTVTWNFTGAGHNTKSLSGQPDSWRSAPAGTANPVGAAFPHRFDTRGRYQYICSIHPFMKGVVTVGTDTVIDTVTKFRTRKLGHRVRISYVLKEPAIVRYRLRGPSPRRVKKGRQLAGAHSFTVRHLKTGTYHGTLTAVDDFDKKNTSKKSFVIG
jgi:plastocyanin